MAMALVPSPTPRQTSRETDSRRLSRVGSRPNSILAQTTILSVAFLSDGEHIVSGDRHGKVRQWQVRGKEFREVGPPMDAKGPVCSIATSQDGKWIVTGTDIGKVIIWTAENRKKFKDFACEGGVNAVDISPDGTRLATASGDKKVVVRSLPDTKQLRWGRIDCDSRTVKFSPDGSLLALAYARQGSSYLGVYGSQDGDFLGNTLISARSLAWGSDSTQLFVLTSNGDIHWIDAHSRATLATWLIHSTVEPTCISVSSNGAFIAASANSSVSFWDIATLQQIGTVIHHPGPVDCMAISSNYNLVIVGSSDVALSDLLQVLSTPYIDHQETSPTERTKTSFQDTIIKLSVQLAVAGRATQHKEDSLNKTIQSLSQDLALLNMSSEKIRELESTIQQLHTQLTNSQQEVGQLRNQLVDSQQDIDRLRAQLASSQEDADQLRTQLADSQQTTERTTQQFHAKLADLQHKAVSTIQQLRAQHANARQDTGRNTDQIPTELAVSQQQACAMLFAHRQKHQCETLYANGRIVDAAKSFIEVTRSLNDDARSDVIIADWLSGFPKRCIVTLENIGDEAFEARKRDQALVAYTTALSLCPSSSNPVLTKWANIVLLHGSSDNVLEDGNNLGLPRFVIYSTICDVLQGGGRVTKAIKCFRQMQGELGQETGVQNEQRPQWELDFQQRCVKALDELAEAASGSQEYVQAEEHYSTILSLNLPDRTDTLLKRSKVRTMMGSWEGALKDADEAIKLDPSSHLGYEGRHAALQGARRYSEATTTFDTLLSKLGESPDAGSRRRSRYADVRTIIRRIIRETTSNMPRVLIDTSTGQLCDQNKLAEAFEALLTFHELVSSMARKMDRTRIQKDVKKFYGYVMFSHRWDQGEPLFQQVSQVTVYKLDASPGNMKLRTFCSLARQLGFRWAWSDTCCIDKKDNTVLQESLVAMFAWYRDASLTIVHLLGVLSTSEEPNALQESIWNSRLWAYQEYIAAKRILFYTADWKSYLGLPLPNHKDSPLILKQMEMPQLSSSEVATLRPGLDRVREKLYLASTRETTLVEDIAYSLLGILGASIPLIYGEGNHAVGRLLEYVLTGSGDVTVLAWTGTANEYNSCLPLDLTVYNPLVPSHIPHMETDELNGIVIELCSSLPDLSLVMAFYAQLNALPSATFVSRRLRLPVMSFPISRLVQSSAPAPSTSLRTYHATTAILGGIDIETDSDLVLKHDHYLVHPWIRPLLDQEHARGPAGLDKTTCALRLVARLKQRFGALLFEKVSPVAYRRVAADSLIMVRMRDEVLLTDLIGRIDTIEVH